MKKVLYLCAVMSIICINAYAQHSVTILVKNNGDKEKLQGATVSIPAIQQSISTHSTGFAILTDMPVGKYDVIITYVGFIAQQISISIPADSGKIVEVYLTEDEDEHEEVVVVQATRTSRSIANIPTRIEVVSGEELAEKANMKPGELRMLLSESTGIQVQQTSATSYNSSIRIQGLDGRYTQILKDGYPLYAGFSGGLSIMQIVPLDLRQVEVIKGSSSTLYGGGAIAGLVNLVSKVPAEKRELNFLANATSAGGLDLSGFYSEKYGKFGLTVFGSRNTGKAYDPASIGLTAIPEYKRYTINPRLFFYGKTTTVDVGVSYITEDRVGGSMEYIKRGIPGYFEQNNTERFSTQAGITTKLTERTQINFKNSYSSFDRQIVIPAYQFSGLQQSSFSEVSYSKKSEQTDWVIGANFLTDDLQEKQISPNPLRNYHNKTYGIFAQHQWTVNSVFTLETGLRGDYVKDYGFELLPRVSAMFRFSPKVTTRIGGGFGYKTPSVFNEESEKIQFQDILPINKQTADNERSVGTNVDVNYRTRIGDIEFTINQLFFYTRLQKPLVLLNSNSGFAFVNAAGHIDTKGAETNIRLAYSDFKFFFGYTYADVNTHFNGIKEWLPLTARHRLNNVLMYEKDEKIKIGLEAYYYSSQRLNDGRKGRSYWIMGLIGEKVWEKFSLYINLENFTDTRQTKFDTIYTGSIENPVFKDIYAPVDGFVVNGGIKIRL